jgi:hypothetical protein
VFGQVKFIDIAIKHIKCYNLFMKTTYSSICGSMVIGMLFAATTQLHAQGAFSTGQQFSITFSATAGSPGTNQPLGSALFYQNGLDYDTETPALNVFVILIDLGENQATDGWLSQMGNGSSLSPILELNNELYDASILFPLGSLPGSSSTSTGVYPGADTSSATANYYSQYWLLTDDQVQNLMAGNWYAQVSYGGDTYLGNLTTVSGVTPVPEPATFALLGLGMTAIFLRRRK